MGFIVGFLLLGIVFHSLYGVVVGLVTATVGLVQLGAAVPMSHARRRAQVEDPYRPFEDSAR